MKPTVPAGQHGGGDVHGARQDDRFDHGCLGHSLTRRAECSGADAEGEATVRAMRVHGKNTPDHLVSPGRQRLERDAHLGRAAPTRWPCRLAWRHLWRLRTSMLLNLGSSFSVNDSTTSFGASFTVLPTAGLERASGRTCACAPSGARTAIMSARRVMAAKRCMVNLLMAETLIYSQQGGASRAAALVFSPLIRFHSAVPALRVYPPCACPAISSPSCARRRKRRKSSRIG